MLKLFSTNILILKNILYGKLILNILIIIKKYLILNEKKNLVEGSEFVCTSTLSIAAKLHRCLAAKNKIKKPWH